jgi:hypothetical protein
MNNAGSIGGRADAEPEPSDISRPAPRHP